MIISVENMKNYHINKWLRYLIKHILICVGVLTVSYISYLYHSIIKELIPILYGVIIDTIIAFIPAAIALSNIRKNFKNKIIDMYSLKEKIKYLRFEVRDIILEDTQDKIQLMLHPFIINEIRDLLRKFEFFHEANILNAFIDQKLLYQLDLLLISILKLTKEYDRGKEWNKIKNECAEALRMLDEVPSFDIGDEGLRNKFIENLDWVLAYELFFEKEDKYPVTVYYGPRLDGTNL